MAAEATPDFVAIDIERQLSTWVLGRCPKAQRQWRALEDDARFERPAWLRRGTSLTEAACRSADIDFRDRWNRDMHQRVTRYLNSAFAMPLRRVFPAIGVSNYEHYDWPANSVVRDLNGHRFQRLGNDAATVGTHQSPQLYGRFNQLRGRIDAGRKTSYFDTPFDAFRAALNRLRSAMLGSTHPLAP